MGNLYLNLFSADTDIMYKYCALEMG